MIRVGVIGVTFGKAVHIPALKLDSRVSVAAVCSQSDRAENVAREFGIPKHYRDWRELIADKSVQAVTIATPPSVQAQILPEALKAGKHVFCEKPMGMSSTLTLEMAKIAEKQKLANMVDFEFPELETWKRAKRELARAGQLKLVLANWQVQASGYKEKVPGWKISPNKGGGTLRYLGCHCLYYLEWMLGPIANVSGQQTDNGDLFRVQLNLKNGGAVDLCVGANTPGTTLHRLEIWAERGRFLLENTTVDYMKGFVLSDLTQVDSTKSDSTKSDSTKSDSTKSDSTKSSDSVTSGNSLISQKPTGTNPSSGSVLTIEPSSSIDGRITASGGVLKKFVDWIETGSAQNPSLRDGARIEHLMECIEKSHASRSVVEV